MFSLYSELIWYLPPLFRVMEKWNTKIKEPIHFIHIIVLVSQHSLSTIRIISAPHSQSPPRSMVLIFQRVPTLLICRIGRQPFAAKDKTAHYK